jgi:hypothetical protein
MKTKEQILQHLKVAGYKRSEIGKIMGFLIGNGTKTPTEAIHYSVGTGTFDDFLAWYQSEPTEDGVDNCPICIMFKLLFSAMDSAVNNDDIETLSYLDELMEIMLDTFIEDTTDKKTNEK